jgi:hypothetical protein
MKKFFATLFAVLVVSLSAANVFAQSMNGAPPYGEVVILHSPAKQLQSP